MKLIMNILKKNNKLGLDNENIDFTNINLKLKEEYNEVSDAIIIYEKDKTLKNLKEIIRETFDLIQVCILVLQSCNTKANTLDEPRLIKEINAEHRNKLKNREWETKEEINIDISRW